MKTGSITENRIFPLATSLFLGIFTALFFWIAPQALYFITFGLFGFTVIFVLYYRPYWGILFLISYLPFEETILAHLPISYNAFVAARFLGEFIIFISLIALFIRKWSKGEKLIRTPIDFFPIAFVFIAGSTIFINQSSLIGSLVNLRPLLRYTALFYLVVNMHLEESHIRRVIKLMILIGSVQITIGVFEILFGQNINPFLLPKFSEIEIAGYSKEFVLLTREVKQGSIFGTLGGTKYYSLFMLIVITIYLAQIEKIKIQHILFLLLSILCVSYTYHRAALLGLIIVLLIHYRMRKGRSRLFTVVSLLLLILFSGTLVIIDSSLFQREYINPREQQISFIQNFLALFTKDYLERTQTNRLGVITSIPQIVLSESPIVGFGPDRPQTIDRLNSSLYKYETPLLRKKEFTNTGFEDVYWVALLAYYGLAGISLFITLFLKLYNSSLFIYKNTKQKITRDLSVITACIVGLCVFFLFLENVLEFRSFSFYFWLLPALMYNLYSTEVRSNVSGYILGENGK